ncbi:MAG: hypothetical protein IT291_10720 [Deltaproteobacteria bacterium]|nr:hypothetical protein [Deltaproteobacteria bacterium]
MKHLVIKRLFDSLNDLEQAIESARVSLRAKHEPPVELLSRIDSYEEILRKQRTLGNDLCKHFTLENWQEVSRHVQLINGLSGMIRDDAREILFNLRSPSGEREKELMLS